jgi:hypothetical protein
MRACPTRWFVDYYDVFTDIDRLTASKPMFKKEKKKHANPETLLE